MTKPNKDICLKCYIQLCYEHCKFSPPPYWIKQWNKFAKKNTIWCIVNKQQPVFITEIPDHCIYKLEQVVKQSFSVQ